MQIKRLYPPLNVIFIVCMMLCLPHFTLGEDAPVKLYFFYMEGCPHCKGEKVFLNKIQNVYKEKLKIIELEVTRNKKNANILNRTGKELNAKVRGVPFTVIGKKYFVGWDDEKSTGSAIDSAIQECLRSPCQDVVSKLIVSVQKGTLQTDSIPDRIKIPLIGNIETKDLSLPLLTIIMAALDGFNPCAMWVLLFLISLLLGMENKRRRWILGLSFLFASALVYFLFMAAWLNLFLFIGYVAWIRIVVGLVALYASYYYIKQFIVNPAGTCNVTEGKSRQELFGKIRNVIQKKNFLLALVGIILLSFSVNLVELICSAGLPAIFTQTLIANDLPVISYYLYISLYIIIFLLDDLIVFVVAMLTLQATGITTKYTHISQLVGGIVMLILGLLLIFKPEWLMFG